METFRRHPAEVTGDRLLFDYERYYDDLSPEERNAISITRRALMRIAEAAKDRASPEAVIADHRTWIGHRTVRQADGTCSSMPFARCACGWAGPGHLHRSAAAQNAVDHLVKVYPERLADDRRT